MRSDGERDLVDPDSLGHISKLMALLQNSRRRDTFVGLSTIAVVCDTIATDARFNMWFLRVTKKRATDEEFIELLKTYEKMASQCSSAVDKFRDDHEKNRFQHEIQTVAAQMMNIMKGAYPE